MIALDINEGVATCLLDAAPANTINPEWCGYFHRALDRLGHDMDWRVLHIRSTLRLFCAGADLKHIANGFTSEHGATEFAGGLRSYQELFFRIEKLPCVTLAEIGGAALGGGLELALCCDLRIVAQEAKIGLPEVGLGLLPAIGGTQRLTALCGQSVAKRLILGGEIITGAEAAHLGLAQWAHPAATLESEAAALARRLAKMPGLALQFAKQCIDVSEPGSTSGFELELSRSNDLYQSVETRRLVHEFVDSKRKT